MPIGHLNIFLEEMSIQALCPFLNRFVWYFLLLSFGRLEMIYFDCHKAQCNYLGGECRFKKEREIQGLSSGAFQYLKTELVRRSQQRVTHC